MEEFCLGDGSAGPDTLEGSTAGGFCAGSDASVLEFRGLFSSRHSPCI